MASNEGPGTLEASNPAKPESCSSTRRKQQVIIVGDFLLQGMETTICEADLLCREVCFSPRAWTVERLPRVVCSSDYYLLLLFIVCTNDTARQHVEHNKHYYRDLIFTTVAWSLRIDA